MKSIRILALAAIVGVVGCHKSGAAASAPATNTSPAARVQLGMSLIKGALDDALRVPEHLAREQGALLALPDTGLARIVYRGRFPGLDEPREGGAYYSFATQSHSYNDEPDLELWKFPGKKSAEFSSGFAGNDVGYLWNLGKVDLTAIDPTFATMLPGIPESMKDRWAFFVSDAKTGASGHDNAFDQRAQSLKIDRRLEARLGDTYLLRSVSDGEHDHVVAFQTLDSDEDGYTLAWRILRKWPVPHR